MDLFLLVLLLLILQLLLLLAESLSITSSTEIPSIDATILAGSHTASVLLVYQEVRELTNLANSLSV